ncbi:MAG TPA: hypothetical protein VHO50_01680 [Bacteroidales bacterium]|nr:hypothetical protein [Bacteroidales bacterium]
MKRASFWLVILFIISCGKQQATELEIKTNGDTIKYGTDFIAELYVPYRKGYLPAFKIIRGSDTSWLPIDTIKKSAILRAASKRSGEKSFSGIVEYIDVRGNKKTETFSIKYYVKPKE